MPRVLAALALLAFLSGCATRPSISPELQEQLGAVRARLYTYVVTERANAGEAAKDMAIDPELTAAAQAHCEAMATRGAFDTPRDGESVAMQRLVANQAFQGLVGENIAMIYFTPQLGIDADAVARTFMDIWLNSPSHRGNIVFPAFDRMGIGLAINDNQIYAAQLFATDLGLAQRP